MAKKKEATSLRILIGMKIRKRREALDMTQQMAAEQCGITQAKLSEYEGWEPGKARMTLETIEKICTGLDMSIVDLLKE
ncbi:MAG TPA: XRE family transcriptional regulator [bacterium]|nr:XRE family transcriptional regulator [bacterium]